MGIPAESVRVETALVWEIQRRELAIKVLGEEAASIAFIGHP
jgi:hypothetical protein